MASRSGNATPPGRPPGGPGGEPDDPCDPSGLCRQAVRRAYRELRDKGQPDRFALEAALAVYLWHHPEARPEGATLVVETWISDGPRH